MTKHQEAIQEIKRKSWKLFGFPLWTWEESHQRSRETRARAPKVRRITEKDWLIALLFAVFSAIAIEFTKIFILTLH